MPGRHIGALNAFSAPSHHHQLSLGTGGLIALRWAIAALVLAAPVAERRVHSTTELAERSASVAASWAPAGGCVSSLQGIAP